MKNIVLCGLPGSGKTTLGRMLAKRAGLPFVDLDDAITGMAGLPVGKIFSGYGEGFFRELETLAVRRAAAGNGQVIATGGGAVLRAENVAALRQNGLLVFVDRPVQAIAGDIAFGGRPLLRGGEAALRALDAKRRDAYLACADYVLPNTATAAEAAEQLFSLYQGLAAQGLAVIGDPIGHSLSPPIHRAALEVRGRPDIPCTAIHVPRGTLPAFVAGARQGRLLGFNVTLPHKKDILPLLDGVDEEARAGGAVNTVARRPDGSLRGGNTDMRGLALALRQAGFGFEGRRVLVLGTGGAAVAVARKSAASGAAAVTVLGRNAQAAEEIVSSPAQGPGVQAHSGDFSPQSLRDAAARTDLLLNCTPLGMAGFGQDFEDLSFLEHLPPKALVCDLIYTPAETALLRRAAALGRATLNGLPMLLWQALLAQDIFLGEAQNKEELYRAAHTAAIEALGGTS